MCFDFSRDVTTCHEGVPRNPGWNGAVRKKKKKKERRKKNDRKETERKIKSMEIKNSWRCSASPIFTFPPPNACINITSRELTVSRRRQWCLAGLISSVRADPAKGRTLERG